MNVSAVIVTRGDVDLTEILESIPASWEKVVYNNSGQVTVNGQAVKTGVALVPDVGVFGRYVGAFEYASHSVCFVQDDDCVLEPLAFQLLTQAWKSHERFHRDALVSNMPEAFRHDFYEDHCLVGFGAMFERRLAQQAFTRFDNGTGGSKVGSPVADSPWFRRTCDVIFTTLTERILVDAPYRNLPWASAPERMWRQSEHVRERQRMLDLVRQVKVST